MRKSILVRAMVLGFLAIAVISAPAASQMQRPFDPSFSADDAAITFLVKPYELLKNEGEDSFMVKEMLGEIEREFGMTLDMIDQVMYQIGTDSENGEFSENLFSVIVRTSQPFEIDRVVRSSWSDADVTEHDGRPMYLSTNTYQPGIYFPDDTTIVIANNPRLKKIAEMPMTMGGMVTRIARIDRDAQFALLFDAESLSEEMREELFGGFPNEPPINVQELIKTVVSANFVVRLTNDVPMLATIETQDAASAEEMKTALQAALELGRLTLPGMKTQLMESAPEEMKEELVKSFDAMITVVKKTKVSHNGTFVEAQLAIEGGMPEFPSILSGMLGGMRMATLRAVEEAERVIEMDEAEYERALERARDDRDR